MAEQEVFNTTNPMSSCYVTVASNPNDIWKTDNILGNHGPLLALQVAFTIFVSNIFYSILRSLHQPRLVAEALAGFVLNPLLLGNTAIGETLLTTSGILNMETYGNMGLMFYVFLSGLEINLDSVLQIRKKATSIAISGIIIPVAIGLGLFAVLHKFYERPIESQFHEEDDKYIAKAYFFWSFSLTVTGFPVILRMLTDLKLLYTRLGRIALTTAMISGTYGWILFVLLIPFASNDEKAMLSVISIIFFILACFFALGPLVKRFIDHKMDQDAWDDHHLGYVLIGLVVCSYITEMLGTHSIVGAFVYGLILPHGRFTNMVLGKLDFYVTRIISPLFFFRFGFTVNVLAVAEQKYWPLMVGITFLLCIPKVLSTLIATLFFNIPARDGVGIGLLLNTKGVLALVILNIGWERKILSMVAFSVMVSAVFLMTIATPILIDAIYKPRNRLKYRLRTIEKLRIDSEFRVLSCVHNIRQATSMISILDACNATIISPLHVFAVELVEHTGCATAFLGTPMHQSISSNVQNLTQSQTESESITNTFNTLAEVNNAIRVETLNAVSDYETIHEDIYNLAEHNRTTLILLPFHKQLDIKGVLETTNATYKVVNQNVMQDAPCSVAIFVDHGLKSLSKNNLRIQMVFIGGPDDREALAIAWKMARHQRTQLSMVRIVLSGEAAKPASLHGESQWISSTTMNEEKQELLDEEYVDSFRLKAVYNYESITYSEKEMSNSDELTSVLHELDQDKYDLYIVGQRSGRNSIVFSNYLEWCDNPELGVIGDIVASNGFDSPSSLLVVQQYGFGRMKFEAQPQHSQNNGSDTLVNTL